MSAADVTEAERISRQQMAASVLIGLIGEALVRNGRWDIDLRGTVWMASSDPSDVERLAEYIGAEVEGWEHNGRFFVHSLAMDMNGVRIDMMAAVPLTDQSEQ